MVFVETGEQELLRQTVAGIAAQFGEAYFREKARAGEKSTELWDAVAEAGFIGVNLPEEYGGGGLVVTEIAIVC